MKHDDTNQNPTSEAELNNETLEELSGGHIHVSPFSLGPDPTLDLPRKNSDEPKDGGATYTW